MRTQCIPPPSCSGNKAKAAYCFSIRIRDKAQLLCEAYLPPQAEDLSKNYRTTLKLFQWLSTMVGIRKGLSDNV